MLSPRRETILRYIVEQYITRAKPVSSQSLIGDYGLGVSSATIRNEMAYLQDEGYIAHPHPSAGSIPLDRGYRYHVQSIGDVKLSIAEQVLVSHLFHQVEGEIGEWLNLAAALIARMVQNATVVTTPKPEACRFKHLELVSLQEFTALIVLVLDGATVREKLITFEQTVSQPELTALASRLSTTCSGLTAAQILAKSTELSGIERQVSDCLIRLMEVEDNQAYEEPYLDGLHFTLNQPEFARDHRIALTLMELIEQRRLLSSIIPPEAVFDKVQVIIGRENKAEAIHNYSVVLTRYGLPKEAMGTISVIGPTRMHYARTIATVSYLASVLNWLIARLYGRKMPVRPDSDTSN